MSKIKIAIVGLNFGKHIIEDIVNGSAGQYMELAAVCDLDEEKAKAFSDKYKIPYFTGSGAKNVTGRISTETLPVKY